MEPVSAIICLGFPLLGLTQTRGDADDPLLDSKTPTMFVIGQHSNTCSIDEMEDMREAMKVVTSMVVVGGADDMLRVSHAKKKMIGITQSMADRCIVVNIT